MRISKITGSMKKESLQDTIKHFPNNPGVYLMKDRRGSILYIGKAKVLSDRVGSYFQKSATLTPKTQSMVNQVFHVEYIVTQSELEALILENNLIKKHRPRYNVVLRDDKNYPYLRLPIQDAFPRLEVVRRIQNDGALYFGPFVPTNALRETLKVIHKTFPLATCEIEIDGKAPRACIEFEIKRCLAPCTGNQSQTDYFKIVHQVRLFLEGKNKELLKSLKKKMVQEAQLLHFEEAARLRDRVAKIERILEKQRITSVHQSNLDVIALAREGSAADLQIFFVRGGLLIGRKDFFWEDVGEMKDQEIFRTAISQFYLGDRLIPEKIIFPTPLEEAPLMTEWLTSQRKGPLRLVWAQRGKDLELVRLVQENASVALREKLRGLKKGIKESETLQKLLGLRVIPNRIEGFDISNLMGGDSVGSMVVWKGGSERPKEYRHFRIKSVKGSNDFAMLQEVLHRHYLKVITEGKEKPDLIIIDGGKGQLNAGCEILETLSLQGIEVLGLAKAKGEKEERVFLPGQPEAIPMPPDSPATHLLQRIRDEAHRFAITYHRKLRKKTGFASSLDFISGVGPVRKRLLLKYFGSLERMREAPLEELQKVPGISPNLAEQVFSELHGEK